MHLPAFRFACIPLVLATGLTGALAANKPDPGSPIIKVADHHMTHARHGAAVAAQGDYIYIFGGSCGGEPVYEAERLNIHTGKVELLTPRFLARRYHNVIEHEGKFHIFSGQSDQRQARNMHETTIEVYDPVTNEVTQRGEMPDPRIDASVAKVGHEVMIIGGSRHRQAGAYAQTNETTFYDPATGAWRPGPPMPTPRESQAVAVGQFVIVPGGHARRNRLKTVEMFVPQEQGWKKLPDLGMPISGHSAAYLGRWIFLFGDYQESDLVLAYELNTRKTIRIKPDFADVRASAAVTHGDRIYVIGGASENSGQAGGGRNYNMAFSRTSERELIQVFALNPDFTGK